MLGALRRQLGPPGPRRRWLLGAIVLALSFAPLFGTLGYENAFVLSPIVALLGIGVGVDAVRRRRDAGSTQIRALVHTAVMDLLRLLGVALGVLLAALLWQVNCDPWGGLAFFAMGPVVSGAVGVVAGLWGGLVARRRSRQLLAAGAVMLASTAIGSWRLIADPVVFAFDPFWGYFSGSIYDEDVSIRRVYVVFRAYNGLGMAAAIAALSWVMDPQRVAPRSWPALRAHARGALGSTGLTLAAVALTIGIGATGPRWGFTANEATINTVLSGTRETEHFVIHYNPRSADARSMDAIATEHEFAWARLSGLMEGREPPGKVHSFLFANAGQKRKLMGAGTVQVAAPWRGQIYLDHRGFPHPVLHHELAHVFGATIGDDLFGVALSGLHLNIALIEGFATAMAETPADHLDLHDQALVLERLGVRPTLESIMGPSFFTKSSRVAYTAAGSFCLWLIETRGFSGMATLYRSAGDFEASYGTSLAALESEWLAFLEARGGVTDDDVQSQRQRFERRSVFRRPCAHRAANLATEIRKADSDGRHDEVVEGYRTLCAIEPEDPAHRIGLSRAQAVLGDFAGALASLDEAAAVEDLTVTLRAALLQRRADVAMAAGNLDLAREALDEALTLPMSRDHQRQLELRLAGAQDATLAPHIVTYFSPFDPDAEGATGAVSRVFAALQIRDQPTYRALGSYLLARQLLHVQRATDAVPLLAEALAPATGDRGLPSAEFERAAQIALVTAAIEASNFAVARSVVATMQSQQPLTHGDATEIELWRQRVEFFARHQN